MISNLTKKDAKMDPEGNQNETKYHPDNFFLSFYSFQTGDNFRGFLGPPKINQQKMESNTLNQNGRLSD